MSENATIPFDGQVVISEEENPELIIYEASSILSIADRPVVDGILMKPNLTVALSESNKRFLETEFELLTDHIVSTPELWKKYGISEEKRGTVMLLKPLSVFPVDFIVNGYEKTGKKDKLCVPEVIFCSEEGEEICKKEAIRLLVEWFYENDYCSENYEAMIECETVDEAFELVDISLADIQYAEDFDTEEEIELLERASLHNSATHYIEQLRMLCEFIYTELAKKYEEAGVLLVKTRFLFGMDEDDQTVLYGEVGTPDESLLVSKMLYEKDRSMVDMLEAPVIEYIKHSENAREDAEIPEDVLDEVSDTCMYLAEALCDDLSFEQCL